MVSAPPDVTSATLNLRHDRCVDPDEAAIDRDHLFPTLPFGVMDVEDRRALVDQQDPVAAADHQELRENSVPNSTKFNCSAISVMLNSSAPLSA